MAGGQERVLRRRIRSVQSTRKITKAMELIAASQIPRALARIIANRPYRLGMQRIILEAALGDPRARGSSRRCPTRSTTAVVLVVTGDRGLSGPYNNASLRAGERLVAKLQSQGTRRATLHGREEGGRVLSLPRHRRRRQLQSASLDRPGYSDAQDIARACRRRLLARRVQQVFLVSTRYLSAGSQAVETEQLLPLVVPELVLRRTSPRRCADTPSSSPRSRSCSFKLMPRAIESEIFSALLEGAASFHTSQQRAMAAATENADELGQTLTRVMNRARQDSITTEIMEIVGGAEALRSGK